MTNRDLIALMAAIIGTGINAPTKDDLVDGDACVILAGKLLHTTDLYLKSVKGVEAL